MHEPEGRLTQRELGGTSTPCQLTEVPDLDVAEGTASDRAPSRDAPSTRGRTPTRRRRTPAPLASDRDAGATSSEFDTSARNKAAPHDQVRRRFVTSPAS